MSSFWRASDTSSSRIAASSCAADRRQRDACVSTFLDFLAFYLSKESLRNAGLHPVLINASPTFSDVSMNGASFDVRRVKRTSFPLGLGDTAFGNRVDVVTKQPRLRDDRSSISDWDEMATEIHVLNDDGIRNHPNIVDIIGLVFYDSGTALTPLILPAIVMEYADYGNIADYQNSGRGHDPQSKYDMCHDIAQGLRYLHSRGIIHGDVKTTNMLVCKHPNREFIVKISDFGFAIMLSDKEPMLKGHTPGWAAPEVYSSIQAKFLPQLDIYSYGIMVYVILKNGALYYDLVPEDGKHQQILRMQETNLMGDLFQMNLLNDTRQGHAFLLQYCHLLRYCLRASPAERFPSMFQLLEHLRFANPRGMTSAMQDGKLVQSVMSAAQSVVALQNLPAGSLDNNPVMQAFLMSVLDAKCAAYVDAIKHNSTLLLDALKPLYRQRMQFEVAMLLPEDASSTGSAAFWICAMLRIVCAFRVLPSMPGEQAPTPAIPKQAGAKQAVESLKHVRLNLLAHHEMIRKLKPVVQQYIFNQLDLSTATSSPSRCAEAEFNVAICYMNGLGIKYDVDKGLSHMHRAATLGDSDARQYLLKVYVADDDLRAAHASEFRIWAQSFDLPETSAWFLEHDYTLYYKSRIVKQILEDAKQISMLPDDTDIDTARNNFLLHVCASLDVHQQVYRMIEDGTTNPTWTNSLGQTLLHIACQNGAFETALVLLANEETNVNAKDCENITALHWLISFPPDQARILAATFFSRGVIVDVHATGDARKLLLQPNLRGAPLVRGTPLMWAIASRNTYCVDLMLSLGADPCARIGGGLSALQYACITGYSPIMLRLREESSFCKFASEYLPLDSERRVNGLFWALLSTGRASRVAISGRSFEIQREIILRMLIEAGASCEVVLFEGQNTMSAAFETAWHQCEADVMRSGLKYGFANGIDAKFGEASSGGPAMSLAIAHQDLDMLKSLIVGGASCKWHNQYNQSAVSLAAKETDDTTIIDALLEAGALVDDPEDSFSPFFAAVHAGHINVAKHLWERGANRDAFTRDDCQSILGALVTMRTRNAVERMNFVLDLPDRDGSDGFKVLFMNRPGNCHSSSALHNAIVPYFTAEPFKEDPEMEERSRATLSALLRKYSDTKYLNSTMGPHHGTPLSMAAEIGNQHVVRMLLEAGADPNIKDEYDRSPLDLAFWRYCYPGTLDVLKEVDLEDRLEISKRLSFINRNSAEIVGLLQSYEGEVSVFKFPAWFDYSPGLRSLDWVMDRLREDRSRSPVPTDRPVWGDLPITIPERPMQVFGQSQENEPSGTNASSE